MARKIRNKFEIGSKVTHVCDDTTVGIVTGLLVRKAHFNYLVTWKDRAEKTHYEYELESVNDKQTIVEGFQIK